MGFKSIGEKVVTHGLFGGVQKTELHNLYSVKLSSLDNKYNCKLELMDQKKICSNIPKIKEAICKNDLRNRDIFLSDISRKSKYCLHEADCNEIHVLLGADVAGKLITGEIEHLPSGLLAIKTKLGWSVMGRALTESKRVSDSSLLVLSLHVNNVRITDLWNLDSLGIMDPIEKQSNEERNNIVLKQFEETITRDNEGRYEVRIPWLDGYPTNISDNKLLSKNRLKNTIKSLKSINKLTAYEQVFEEWENEGVIERIPIIEENLSNSDHHYLPHRAVFKENSTTKIRPVFDGSARTRNNISLNECIEKGPNLIELIPSILNRFRLNKLGVIADIRRAFLQINLHAQDRDYLRFIWWKEGNPADEIVFRHRRVVFGLSCSPFLLAATLSHHLNNAPEHLRGLAKKLKDSMYVDNCVASVDSEEELEYFRSETQNLLASAKFDLRGWRSNCVENGKLQDINDTHEVPLLGLIWNIKEDTLSCDLRSVQINEEGITKRKILSLAHKIFDPVGYTCPVTLIPKLLLQECWSLKLSWDCPLPDNITNAFKKWKNQVPELKNVKIPRRFSELSIREGKLSLHTFCDACKTSYATCVFLRIEFRSEVTCQLVQARSRVAPLKNISIPRLELLACCIGARLADMVIKDIQVENIETYYYSDSMDAVHWIKGEGPWATFVANRVKEIRKLSSIDSWKFVPGSHNPADLPSRGCSIKTLIKSEWWNGPEWLLAPENDWLKFETEPNFEIINSEKKKTVLLSTAFQNRDDIFHRFSSYSKILRIVAWVFRFFDNCKKCSNLRLSGQLENTEIRRAELSILKTIQSDEFSNNKEKTLKPLQILRDDNGILRVKTKVFMKEDDPNFKLPIVLPSDHVIVRKLIIEKHKELGHCGVQLLMCALRENYWILKSRRTIKRTIKTCVTCQKFDSQPPKMIEGVLPEDRVRDANIFEVIGIDLAGPLILKNGEKAWILIFTCAVFRAVHLELLSSVSTDNFLLGLRRFISRRGRPSIIYSDNGTNFVGAQNLLRKIDWDKVKSQSNISPITWKFIPPAAPWWGGFWERMIGIIKRILRRVLGRSSLNFEEMNTVLCDCESIVNSRPLSYVSDDIEDLSPLTPSMFLQEVREMGVPDLDVLDHKKMNKRLKYRNKIRQDLRSRFRIEYLGQLRQTISKGKESRILKIGDIVIICSDNSNRVAWPLGRVIEVYPSKDGVIRVVKIKTKTGIIIRPVGKLCPLELNDEVTGNAYKDIVSVTKTCERSAPLQQIHQPMVTRTGRVVRRPKRLLD